MFATVKLPRGVRATDIAATTRHALRAFIELPPTMEAVSRWLACEYREALVGDVQAPVVMPDPTETDILAAQVALRELRSQVATGDFIEELPTRVNIARVCDQFGGLAFGHVDATHTPLRARVCALFLADYLTAPEEYLLAQ